MKKKLTMQDIADMAGVTKSTISRYFNGGYVKDETRQTIQKIIDKYNYEPNTFAQSLKAKESRIIGVIAPCLDSTVSGRMLMSIDAYLRKENYTSLFINTDHDEKRELNSMESLWRMKVDGIILLATKLTEEHHLLQQRMDVPILYMAQQMEHGISIIYDDYNAGKKVGTYAGERGFQKVAYVGVSEADKAVGCERKKGVLDGLQSCGVKQIEVFESDFSYEHSIEIITSIWESLQPELIICATDRQAMAAYHVIQEKGFVIGREVSVIGFGGYEVSSVLNPRLTTIKFNAETAGYLAGETMVKMIHGDPVSKTQVVDFIFQEGTSVR